MRKALCLLLAVGFLHSQELSEEIVTLESSLNVVEGDLVAVNEPGDFRSELTESSFGTLTEKDTVLSDSKKNGVYFFLPTINFSRFFLPGIAFRHELKGDFLEVSYFSDKADITLQRYEWGFPVETLKQLGTVYGNIVNASYGFRWNTRYVNPYISLGVGAYLPYVKYMGTSSADLLPTVASALGLGFKYGFVDLALNYLPIRWTGVFHYEGPEVEDTFKQKTQLLANFRVGLGFPF